jgi:hypothetical protein
MSSLPSRDMWLDRLVDLGPIVVAIVVPWLTFQFALQQDERRSAREQRSQLYVDLLTEAYAEQQWVEGLHLPEDDRAETEDAYPDLRLKPADRARLGARVNAFATEPVMVAFGRLNILGMRYSLPLAKDPAEQMAMTLQMGDAFNELQAAVRAELSSQTGRPWWRLSRAG